MSSPTLATVPRPVSVLVPLIQQELKLADAAGLEHYRRAGTLLLEAKKGQVHGRWASWLRENFNLSHDTASVYMLAAQNSSALEFRSLRAMRSARRKPRPKIRPEEAPRGDDARDVRALAEEVIDVGYKALAQRHHPDRGGSSTAMSRLNRARIALRKCIRAWV